MQRNTTQRDGKEPVTTMAALDPDAVATRLGVTRRTVTDKAALGEFPGAFRVGNRWRIPLHALEAFIAANSPRIHRPGTIEPRRARRKAS